MIKAVSIEVFGRVQGVGFRYYAQKKALELQLNGFVKNMPSGSVIIEAEGDEEALEQFLLWCHKGPSWARVQEVKYQIMPPFNYTKFETR